MINLDKNELKGPLSFFQATYSDKEGTYDMFKALANANENNFRDEETLRKIYELSWTEFSNRLKEIKNKTLTEFPNQNLTILTSRQLEILRLFSEGKKYRKISEVIGISHLALRNYIAHMKNKLMVKTIDKMVLLAKQNDLI